MNERRKIERLKRGADGEREWEVCSMGDLVPGDVFRMFDPGDGPGEWVPADDVVASVVQGVPKRMENGGWCVPAYDIGLAEVSGLVRLGHEKVIEDE